MFLNVAERLLVKVMTSPAVEGCSTCTQAVVAGKARVGYFKIIDKLSHVSSNLSYYDTLIGDIDTK